jgi:branched-chain amino acid transport system substrate-binding protein
LIMKREILVPAAVILALVIAICYAQVEAANLPEPIVLGNPQSLGFEIGKTNVNAIALAVDEINAGGGVNIAGKKHPFKLVSMDSRDIEPGVPVSEGLLVVEKMILERGAKFIISGLARTEATLALMDLLPKYKVININAISMSPGLGAKVAKDYDKYKYFFSTTPWADWLVTGELGPCIQDIGKKFGINKLFIIVQDVAHARAGGEIFEKVMKGKGWEVVGRETYPTGSADFSSGLLKARRAGPCILFLWGEMPEFNVLMRQWYDMKIPALPIGMVVYFGDPGLWEATKGQCAYAMSDAVVAGNVPSKATPWTMKFVEAYKKKYGREPGYHGEAESYIIPYIIKDAVERAKTLDPDAVIKAIEQTNMMGVSGRVRFDPKSHRLISSLNPEEGTVGGVFQWQDGKRVTVFPRIGAMGEVRLPPWMK